MYLIHETAHIARHDAWINMAQRFAAVLWWWHPGVLMLNRMITRLAGRAVRQLCASPQRRSALFADTAGDRGEVLANRPLRSVARAIQAWLCTGSTHYWSAQTRERDHDSNETSRRAWVLRLLLGATSLLIGGARILPGATKARRNSRMKDSRAGHCRPRCSGRFWG